jgi:hypothetical protein
MPSAPTPTPGDSSTALATTAFVAAAVAGAGGGAPPSTSPPLMDGTAAAGASTKYSREDQVHPSDTSRAPLASPSFTGTPTAPTATAGTSTTQIATTQFVAGAVAASVAGVSQITAGSGIAASPATGNVTVSVAPNGVTNSLAAQMAPNTLKGNNGGTTASPADLTVTQAMTMLGAAPLASPTFTGTPNAPTPTPANDTSTKIATTAFVQNAVSGASAQIVGGINDNRIINGNFAVNQRAYVSGTALAAAAYGHDRWKAGASGCTCTFTATLPDTTVTITAGTLTQIIQAGMIEGGVYTLSWTGTAQARVYQGAPSGSYAASPIITAALPAGVNTIIEFNTGTVTRVKLETGSVATPYPRQSLAKSMADCQWYYQVGQAQLNPGANALSGIAVACAASHTPMRATATMVIGTNSNSNISSPVVTDLGSAFRASGTATAAGVIAFNMNFSASAEL